MNCESHKQYPDDIRCSSRDAEARSRLAADVAGALHDMAQPLTILRASVGALTLRGDVPDNARRYLEMSVRQVERICELLSGMQQRVDADQDELISF